MAYPVPPKNLKTMDQSSSTTPVAKRPGQETGGSWLKGLVTLIVVLVIIGGGIYLIASYTGVGSNWLPGGSSLRAQWQAVFLTNGQVYFGKVDKITNDLVVLTDIYYLQVVTQPLQRSQEGDTTNQETQQRLTLIKLGNELHGPRDEMVINRDHVVIMEDLKDDSRVVQAINDYVNSQKNSAAQ
jgi:hypothetical protein